MVAIQIRRATRAATIAALSALSLASAASAEPGSAPREPACASPAELAANACELGHWATAEDLLRAVQPRDRSSEAWLCLARARVQLGQWVAALDSYDELAELPMDSAARRLGAAERRQLEARLAWLKVVPSLPLPDDARLTLDGEPIARARVGVAFPVQPGRHWLLLEQRDGARIQQSWRLEEGEHRRVGVEVTPFELTAVAPAPTLVAGPARPSPAPVRVSASRGEPAESYARWSRWALYGAGIGAGVGIGLLAAAGNSDSDDARDALVGVGLGTMLLSGVSLMTGVTLGIMSEQRPERPPQPSLQPWLSTRGAGVAGRF